MALNSAQLIATGQLDGFRNRIINGDMRIAQRGVPQTLSAAGYVIDRWNNGVQGGGAYSVNQSTDTPTIAQAGTKFANSMLVTVTTADASIAAGDIYWPQQRIEGNNIADAGFGATGAKTLTLSFWVKSSLTGTYALGAINNGQTRSYGTTYTISSANTWEKKIISIPGDASGTWASDTNTGINIIWGLGAGSSYAAATPDTWTSTTVNIVTSAATRSGATASAFIATLGATFQLTGVQLEVGTVATDFDFRSYGQELALCQRYCYAVTGAVQYGVGFETAAIGRTTIPLPVTMRAAPVLTTSAASTFSVYDAGGLKAGTVFNADYISQYSVGFNITASGTLTNAGCYVVGAGASTFVIASAEL